MAANGHDLGCSTRKLSASPKSTTTEAALGRQLQECPFRETKRPSHGTASKENLQYSQFCQQEYSAADDGLVPNGFHRIYRVQADNEEASSPYRRKESG
ncbi:hypothetical protein IFM47457_08667 [Aspergillus lentulus]|nr:hypothetical protein IFM47457_08667 [Aspergillus lentulus]